MQDARWLFFDLGNTLVSEEAATEYRLQRLVSSLVRYGRRCSIDEVRSAFQEASAEFAPRLLSKAIEKLIDEYFDLTPVGIIKQLDLRRPIYKQTAVYGHFGRSDLDLPWERTDKAAQLAEEAGVQRLQVMESQDA